MSRMSDMAQTCLLYTSIVFLPVSVAASNTLLNTLRIPRKVIVDDQAAKLQVDSLCGCLGS